MFFFQSILLICRYGASNVQQSGTIFLARISLLSQCIDISCLFIGKKTYIAFNSFIPLLFLLPFIGLNFKSLSAISLFHLNCKISFGFLPIKEKSLGLLKLASKIKEIWMSCFNSISSSNDLKHF